VIKILLVEDNEMNRDMLMRRLARKGYEVLGCVDAEEAIVLAGTATPNLILMDIGLPKMNGWDATRILKAGAATRHIPVIALTADAMLGLEEKARDAGCDDFDTKPVDFARLLEKIRTLAKDEIAS
jgi:two-component system, cell cycle response regulator DivK